MRDVRPDLHAQTRSNEGDENPGARGALISVIVPVYNSASHLRQCLDSIVSQSYESIELICIDDGSTDESGRILDEYASREDWISVVHQANAGPSASRNLGLSRARGSWVIFVDADDWIEQHTCSEISRLMGEYDCDLLLWPYISEYPTTSKPRLLFGPDFRIFSDGEVESLHRGYFGPTENELRAPGTADSTVTVWGKAYRGSMLRDSAASFVDTGTVGTSEDALFNILATADARRVAYTPSISYHYRRGNSRSITESYKPELLAQWHALWRLMRSYLSNERIVRTEVEEAYSRSIDARIAVSVLGLGLNALSSKYPIARKIDEIQQILGDPTIQCALKTLPVRVMPAHWAAFFVLSRRRQARSVYWLLRAINYARS